MSENDNSENDEILSTPPEICEIADSATKDLLPVKSKEVYASCYQSYTEWKNSSNTKSSSERVLMAYFKKLSTQYKASTLWSSYSMLKCTIKLNEKIDIGTYHSLIAFLKRQAHGYESKKSKVLTTNDVNKFITEAPDNIYLLTKVVLIFGITGACRKDKLTKVTMQNIEYHGDLILVKIPDTKTSKPRSFTILAEFSKIVMKYKNLRPVKTTTDRFFINYKNGKCTVQVVGKNKFGSMPKEIAAYLKLPDSELYTGHCFRRTSGTVLADAGANITALKRHGDWKSASVAEGYIEESIANKAKIGSIISSAINLPIPSTSKEYLSCSEEPPPKLPKLDVAPCNQPNTALQEVITHEKKYFNFDDCSNITINYCTMDQIRR